MDAKDDVVTLLIMLEKQYHYCTNHGGCYPGEGMIDDRGIYVMTEQSQIDGNLPIMTLTTQN